MPDAVGPLPRRGALATGHTEPALGRARDDAIIRVLPPRARFSVRLAPSLLKTIASVAGFTLDMPINRCVAALGCMAMRLGPDEWQLSGPAEETSRINDELRTRLAGVHHALVDVSHRHVAFSVSGARARDAVNAGCPLDLEPAVFGAGHATRTLLGRCEVLLSRPDAVESFEIESGRSFAGYVHDFLHEAARQFRR
jgi:sarcosine oxidase, subunit gamma